MHFILFFCQKAPSLSLLSFFIFPSKPQKQLIMGQEKEAQTKQTQKKGNGRSRCPHGAEKGG